MTVVCTGDTTGSDTVVVHMPGVHICDIGCAKTAGNVVDATAAAVTDDGTGMGHHCCVAAAATDGGIAVIDGGSTDVVTDDGTGMG